jgi:general stress protein 26
MTQDHTERARALLMEHTTGVLATLASNGGVRARTVHYAANDAFELFFVTLAGTRKVEDINADHRAAFVISDPEAPRTLQIEGVLSEQPDTAIIDPMVQKLMDTLMEKGDTFAPLTRLDADNILFYKLTPTWIRLGDFTRTGGSDSVYAEITP